MAHDIKATAMDTMPQAHDLVCRLCRRAWVELVVRLGEPVCDERAPAVAAPLSSVDEPQLRRLVCRHWAETETSRDRSAHSNG